MLANKIANIVSMEKMLDMLTDFFNTMMDRFMIVGGCAGTTILKDVMDAATVYCEFKKILVLDGCCDNVVSMKTPLVNYMYYADLFAETIIDSIEPFNIFKPDIMNPHCEYRKIVDDVLLRYYDCIIINNVHYIPNEYVHQIYHHFGGKIVCIADPFDIGGELFAQYPTVIDTLIKLSPKIATARNMYHIETRFIDKRIHGLIDKRKLNKRSIGRIDENQYVTDSEDFANAIRDKQYKTQLRRRHKLFVTSDHLFMYPDQAGGRRIINKGMILQVINPVSRPYMKLKIHASKLLIQSDVSYTENSSHVVNVQPANILTLDQFYSHKFAQIVFVQTKTTNDTRRHYYTLLKNSINLIMCKY